MSTMITNTIELESQPAIKNTIRKVNFNPLAFRSSADTPASPNTSFNQILMLSNICKRIND